MSVWRRLVRNRPTLAGLAVLAVIALLSIVAPMLSPYTYHGQSLDRVALAPTFSGPHPHFFGTDDLGRDIWTRLWFGGRISLSIGFVAALLNLLVGATYGSLAGYVGGWVDDLLMRAVEVISGVPVLLLLILFSLVVGPGIWTIILSLALVHWTGMARLVRGQVLQLKEQEYVLAARAMGASPARIIVRHLIPNAMGPILVSLTMAIPGAIFFEAALSFMGMGVKAPAASWGVLVSEGRSYLLLKPHILLFPASAISLTMLAFSLVGDGLRDAMDPRVQCQDPPQRE